MDEKNTIQEIDDLSEEALAELSNGKEEGEDDEQQPVG